MTAGPGSSRPPTDEPGGPDAADLEADETTDGDVEDEASALDAPADEEPGGGEDDTPSGRPPLDIYLQEISRIPLLTREQEVDLAKRVAAGDQGAVREMVEANLRLVVMIARRYKNRGLPLADLIAEGNLGLLRAVEKYRWERGTRFSTYGTWWIRQAVVRALANQSRLIRLPVHIEALLSRYRRVKEQLTGEQDGRAPSLDEIAAKLGIPVENLEGLEDVAKTPLSLEMPVGPEEAGALKDVVADQAEPGPAAIAAILRQQADLLGILDSLPATERTIITDRFGLEGDPPMTLEAIGRRMGVSRERVRQIEAGALQKLRRRLETRGIGLPEA